MPFFLNKKITPGTNGSVVWDLGVPGILALSHVEPAGHILFDDNALIPLNSIITVG